MVVLWCTRCAKEASSHGSRHFGAEQQWRIFAVEGASKEDVKLMVGRVPVDKPTSVGWVGARAPPGLFDGTWGSPHATACCRQPCRVGRRREPHRDFSMERGARLTRQLAADRCDFENRPRAFDHGRLACLRKSSRFVPHVRLTSCSINAILVYSQHLEGVPMPYTYQYPRPALTVDCVVFGFDEVDFKVRADRAGSGAVSRANGPCLADSCGWTSRWTRPRGGNCPRRRA